MELARDPHEPLATKWTARLSTVTNQLADASESRRVALQTLAVQNTSEELFIDAANRELDILEGELHKRFPGELTRVAAFLDATRPTAKRRRVDAEDPSETG